MADQFSVLSASVARLRDLVGTLGPDQLRAPAYPTEWTVADVLSHIGSGALLAAGRIDAGLGGPDQDPQPVWDEWNAKDPDAKAADALVADAALIERIEALNDDERGSLQVSLGPMKLDYAGFLTLRTSEHIVHSWDIAVTFDPTATLAADGVPIVLDVIPIIGGFIAKPTGSTREVRVHTTELDGQYLVSLTPDGVALAASDGSAPPDLELPAEAFVRLVYGRLDPDHTPDVKGAEGDLDELRRTFPGF
jgi:uncharacterized protein (TIGR03083 family)